MFETTSDFVWQRSSPAPGMRIRGPLAPCWRWRAVRPIGARRRWPWKVPCAPGPASLRWQVWSRCWRLWPPACPSAVSAPAKRGPRAASRPRISTASGGRRPLFCWRAPGWAIRPRARPVPPRPEALVKTLLPGFSGSAVLDADGLNAAADLLQTEKMLHPQGELILTPHPGEMARLTGHSAAEINADREGTALRYAKAWNAVVVLKGAHTVIAGPDGRCASIPPATRGFPGAAAGMCWRA